MEAEAVEREVLRVEAEAIQKLPLPYPWLDQFILVLIFKLRFKFKFIDFKKTKFKFKFKFIDFEKTKFKFIGFANIEFNNS